MVSTFSYTLVPKTNLNPTNSEAVPLELRAKILEQGGNNGISVYKQKNASQTFSFHLESLAQTMVATVMWILLHLAETARATCVYLLLSSTTCRPSEVKVQGSGPAQYKANIH